MEIQDEKEFMELDIKSKRKAKFDEVLNLSTNYVFDYQKGDVYEYGN